jgi:hypothetical protein
LGWSIFMRGTFSSSFCCRLASFHRICASCPARSTRLRRDTPANALRRPARRLSLLLSASEGRERSTPLAGAAILASGARRILSATRVAGERGARCPFYRWSAQQRAAGEADSPGRADRAGDVAHTNTAVVAAPRTRSGSQRKGSERERGVFGEKLKKGDVGCSGCGAMHRDLRV